MTKKCLTVCVEDLMWVLQVQATRFGQHDDIKLISWWTVSQYTEISLCFSFEKHLFIVHTIDEFDSWFPNLFNMIHIMHHSKASKYNGTANLYKQLKVPCRIQHFKIKYILYIYITSIFQHIPLSCGCAWASSRFWWQGGPF